MARPNMGMRSYQAAIALSNCGVTLLERRCFNEAIVAFRDALDQLRYAFPGVDFAEDENEVKIATSFQKSTNSLIRIASSKDIMDELPSLPFDITILEDQCCAVDPKGIVESIGYNTNAFAIRIDDSFDDGGTSIDLNSAIILLNYGTAYRCCITSKASLQNSYKYSHLSYGVLCRRLSYYLDVIDDVEASKLLLTCILSVQNLIYLSQELLMPVKAQSLFTKLFQLKNALVEIGNKSCIKSTRTMAAAA